MEQKSFAPKISRWQRVIKLFFMKTRRIVSDVKYIGYNVDANIVYISAPTSLKKNPLAYKQLEDSVKEVYGPGAILHMD